MSDRKPLKVVLFQNGHALATDEVPPRVLTWDGADECELDLMAWRDPSVTYGIYDAAVLKPEYATVDAREWAQRCEK